MFTLLRGAEVWAPEPLGRRDILLGAGRILALGEELSPPGPYPCRVVEAGGLLVLPGLVDGHVHLAGGGGEAGPASRTAEAPADGLLRGGVTTAVGLLGVDSVSRSVEGLLACARSLRAEGLTVYIYCGAYQLPARTLTGSVRRDLVLVPEVLGVGEVAINDHRSGEPGWQGLARLAAEARVGGLLGGKPGLVHLHVGEGRRGLALLREVLAETDLPASQFYPTHLNRQRRLLEEAADLGRLGMPLDLTAGLDPQGESPGALPAAEALLALRAAGVPSELVTVSSDGRGSLPRFDGQGHLVGWAVSPLDAVWQEVRRAVLAELLPLGELLPACTCNPAAILGLRRKGRLAPGMDADLLLVTPHLEIRQVLVGGEPLWEAGSSLQAGGENKIWAAAGEEKEDSGRRLQNIRQTDPIAK